MPNPVLDRLQSQKQHQIDFVGQLLERVEAEERDLVDAERANLEHARERIAELEPQITQLVEFDSMVAAHHDSVGSLPAARRAGDPRPMSAGPAVEYRSAGHFIVDLMRARGLTRDRNTGQQLPADPDAGARVTRAIATQTTTDTPGLLPVPIIGQIVSLIDASRPFITSLGGALPMGGIPGKSFERPKITQHTLVGTQPGEKTELPSRKMTISPVTFTKQTEGGTVNVSRQDIDWTSPSAWDALVKDLADVYAVDTETVASTAFATSVVTNSTTVLTNDLKGWAAGLYAAAGQAYAGARRLPDRVWCSIDVWGQMGAVVDVAHLAFPPGTDGPSTNQPGAFGESDLSDFGGYVLQLPRIVVPAFPAGTCIVGNSSLFEVYEEVIGLLSVIEPSILGVEVAYGGYIAYGTLGETGFAKLVPPAGP